MVDGICNANGDPTAGTQGTDRATSLSQADLYGIERQALHRSRQQERN